MMDNQEKIFNKIKHAANSAPGSFPSMEKVWSRVEDKLDHKVLARQSKTWKKLAVAASVLLVATLGGILVYEATKTDLPKNQVVIIEPTIIDSSESKTETAVTESPKPNPTIKENASQILDKQLNKKATAAVNDEISATDDLKKEAVAEPVAPAAESVTETEKSGKFMRSKAFNAKGVVREDADAEVSFESKRKAEAQTAKKEAPLVVIDGKPMTGEKSDAKLNPDLQDITILKEPLYIINGHYYTEQEMFGPNPTSPYAPLNQQEIETIKILQGDKATANYGKRGEKGVVVITTKGRKPAEKAVKTDTKTSGQGQ